MSEITIKPIADKILVEVDKTKEEVKGGIIITEAIQKKELRYKNGTVVAIGNGKNEVPPIVKVGDKIMFSVYVGIPIEDNGKEYLILKEDEISAIL